MKKIVVAGTVLAAFASYAEPPMPEVGYRWVLNEQFSDEFNGTSLDRSKWINYVRNWEGRAPGLFVPDSVSVKDGSMQIKCGVLDKPKGDYTIKGGAVSSVMENAHFGYYEARMKASRIGMSSTFWMTGGYGGVEGEHKGSTHDQELDITETVGGPRQESWKSWYELMMHRMGTNSHYHHWDLNGAADTKSKGKEIHFDTHVSDAFHTYGVWWKDAKKATIYADDIYDKSQTIRFDTTYSSEPFNNPMGLRMVAETYDWEPVKPSFPELLDDTKNTVYYDWVRSYAYVPVDEEFSQEEISRTHIRNGGFELGDWNGWSRWTRSGSLISVVDHDQRSGNYALEINGEGASEQFGFNLKPNTKYRVICYGKVGRSGSKLLFGVKDFKGSRFESGSRGEVSTTITETDYTRKTLEFTTGSDYSDFSDAKVYVYSGRENYLSYVDDFKIVQLTNTAVDPKEPVAVFNEEVAFTTEQATLATDNLSFTVNYKANAPRKLVLELKDTTGKVASRLERTALAGYANLKLSFSSPVAPGNYTAAVSLYDGERLISTAGHDVALFSEWVSFPLQKNRFENEQIRFVVNYKTVDARKLVVEVKDSTGQLVDTIEEKTARGDGNLVFGSDLAFDQSGTFTAVVYLCDEFNQKLLQSTPYQFFVVNPDDGIVGISNSGFEKGSLANWLSWGTSVKVVNHDSFKGMYAVRVAGAGAAEKNNLTLKADTTYKISCYAKVDAAGSPISFGIKGFGGETSISVNSTSYKKYSITIRTGNNPSDAKLFFYSGNAGTVAYGDEFSITELYTADGVSSPSGPVDDITVESISFPV